ncbi:hypothetical protein GCM10022409_30100 [Hymenobacter glaciei]|uniref:CsbD family protein n=1 Tax=Hymenobacter glaciei TaxID=877209 RepID=A0ABP7UFF7_9BACT
MGDRGKATDAVDKGPNGSDKALEAAGKEPSGRGELAEAAPGG